MSEFVEEYRMGQNKKRVEREMDLINQMTGGSMVDTEKMLYLQMLSIISFIKVVRLSSRKNCKK